MITSEKFGDDSPLANCFIILASNVIPFSVSYVPHRNGGDPLIRVSRAY